MSLQDYRFDRDEHGLDTLLISSHFVSIYYQAKVERQTRRRSVLSISK